MFSAVIAHSDEIDTREALDDTLAQCRARLGERSPQAGIVFCALELEHDAVLDGILRAWPGLQLIGCTTDGEISSVLGFRDDSIALVLFCSDTIEFSAGMGREVSKDIASACRTAVASASSRSTLAPALCIALPESLTTSALQIVESLAQELGPTVPVVGGTAGDGRRFDRTRQFCGRDVSSDAVPVLLLSGPLVYSIGVENGYRPVGAAGRVTRADGTVVHEINGRPALEFFRRFLGGTFVPVADFPLAILDATGEVQCIRSPSGTFDEATGSISFYAEVPEGASVQITETDREGILDGCTQSITRAFEDYPAGKTPGVAMLISCASRKMLLGTRTGEESRIVKSVIGQDVPICGFYSYGEIGPRVGSEGITRFHNGTFISLMMGA